MDGEQETSDGRGSGTDMAPADEVEQWDGCHDAQDGEEADAGLRLAEEAPHRQRQVVDRTVRLAPDQRVQQVGRCEPGDVDAEGLVIPEVLGRQVVHRQAGSDQDDDEDHEPAAFEPRAIVGVGRIHEAHGSSRSGSGSYTAQRASPGSRRPTLEARPTDDSDQPA